mmetsp:Transcript_32985/g.72347  ORF Transcript_32985/g.72347 Transcript_32985/m.72347 type:complete len:437 (+) Transcript_32985:93-1403(+)
MAKPKRQQKQAMAAEGAANGGGKKQRVKSCAADVGEDEASDTSDTSCIPPPPPPVPELPSLIWSRILSDYIPHNYPTLICFSSVNRFFLRDVIPNIKRLALYETRELHVAPLHRFKSVTSVEIRCLIRIPADDVGVILRMDGDQLRRLRPGQELDIDAARRIPLFLSRLGPSLKKAFIGATSCKETYDEDICVTPGHREAYRELIRSLCSAYRMGAISRQLDLTTLYQRPFCEYDKEFYDFTDEDHEPCDTCRDVCRSFPFDNVLNLPVCKDRPDQASFCMSDEERLDIIASRRGGREYLQSPYTMMKILQRECMLGCFRKPLSNDDLILKLADKFYGVESAVYLRKERRHYIKLLSQFGCDWSSVDGPTFKRLTFECLNGWLSFYDDGIEVVYMFQSVFDFLGSVGAPVRSAKYTPIPDSWDVENEVDSDDGEEE